MNPRDPGTYPERACATADPEVFFLDETAKWGDVRVEALSYCRRCPVMAECLEWALWVEGAVGHSSRSGIYGGKSPTQRAKIHARRRKDAA